METNGNFTIKQNDVEIKISRNGNMTIKGDGYETSFSKGNYCIDQYTEIIIEGTSNKYFEAKVTSEPFISRSWKPGTTTVDGYVPVMKYSVDIKNNNDTVNIKNTTTVSLSNNIRDTVAVVGGAAIGAEIISELLKMGYSPELMPQ